MYACNERDRREALWEELRSMALKIDGPWVVCGDFNCVLNCDERVGAPCKAVGDGINERMYGNL